MSSCPEHEAARIASVHRTDSAAASHHVAATKDATIGPLHAGNNHILTVPFPYHHHNPYAVTGGGTSSDFGSPAASPWNTLAAVQSVAGGANDWLNYPAAFAPLKPSYNVWG